MYLKPNRVSRTYRGGLLLERFRGYPQPMDDWSPEDWLGSTTMSRLKTVPNEGLSVVTMGDEEYLLADIIERYPAEMLGEKHVQAFGTQPFLLTRLLDSSERLRIQVHPSRQEALSLFGSPHGKAEAWCILETRTVGGVSPYILLGFREGVSTQDFRTALLREDSEALVSMLHRVDVKPGDMFMVDAGVPHAIGSGVFMLEIQEPSDLTIYAERSGNLPLDHESNHLGLGWERALEIFQYQGLSAAENMAKRRLLPVLKQQSQSKVYETVMGEPTQPYFGLTEFVVGGQTKVELETYGIAIVSKGAGTMTVNGHEQSIREGDVMFWPASLGVFSLASQEGSGELKVLCCHPPSHYF